MKKVMLLLVAGLVWSAGLYAQDESGALGLGLMTDSSEQGFVGGGVRFTLHLDVGYKLTGPLYYGFEFQGSLKKLNENTTAFDVTEVSIYALGQSTWVSIQNSTYRETFTLWDADFSPRGYFSFEVGSRLQLLGFAGLNYNWQTLDYRLRTSTPFWYRGQYYTDYRTSDSIGGTWSALAGARATVGAFYLDYTRFLEANSSGNYAWNQYNKDRLGLGINLRF